MKFENFDNDAKRILAGGRDDAKRRKQQLITCEHLLLAALADPDAVWTRMLRRASIDMPRLRAELEQELARVPEVSGAGEPFLTEEALDAVKAAEKHAERAGSKLVNPGALVLGMLDGPSSAALALREQGATAQKLRDALTSASGVDSAWRKRRAPGEGGKGEAPEERASGFPEGSALWRFTRDLTAMAAAGELDPVIGRDDEMRRVIQIIGRRTKNNPVVIGEPGVGKTALVEGLARRIAEKDVPRAMQHKRIAALDLGAVVAGARAKGEFEQRVRSILGEVQESAGEIILFIDEMHTVVGAGGGGGGSMGAADLLKPALARGTLTVVGATTTEEYRKHIEKDPALERRFLPILLEQPDDTQAVAILRGVKPIYELHHGVRITDDALVAAVKLSARYITERALPDKAIDLMDEAASRLRMELDSVPHELDDLQRDVEQFEIELRALEDETTRTANKRRTDLESRLTTLREQADVMRQRWQKERDLIAARRQALAEHEAVAEELHAAERTGDLNLAARLKYGAFPEAQKRVEAADAQLAELSDGDRLLNEEVRPENIAEVIAIWTGIPVSKMLESERVKLLQMEDRLRHRVVGQDIALAKVAEAVRLSRAGLGDPKRPIGSFMFLGPTGVGKTELARALAEFMFDDENAMVRLDMSEFMEKAAAQRLTGAPPGYVGYDEGGQLTEAIRRKPYAVLLFDEVEKGHPDVFNTLLQLLEDGRLTDSHGRTSNFSNTLVIMTSNLGGADILDLSGRDDEEMERRVMGAVKGHFRPEFINRIDELIIFKSLGRDTLRLILDILLRKLRKTLDPRQINLELTDEAAAAVVEAGYEPRFGARPLKRAVLRMVQRPLANQLLQGEIGDGAQLVADVGTDPTRLSFRPQEREEARTSGGDGATAASPKQPTG